MNSVVGLLHVPQVFQEVSPPVQARPAQVLFLMQLGKGRGLPFSQGSLAPPFWTLAPIIPPHGPCRLGLLGAHPKHLERERFLALHLKASTLDPKCRGKAAA